jgi:hypothetical protein
MARLSGNARFAASRSVSSCEHFAQRHAPMLYVRPLTAKRSPIVQEIILMNPNTVRAAAMKQAVAATIEPDEA